MVERPPHRGNCSLARALYRLVERREIRFRHRHPYSDGPGSGQMGRPPASRINVRSRTIADLLAWAATILGAIATATGLFVTGLYRDVPFWAEQARGIDLATLFLAVPILIIALLAARRLHRRSSRGDRSASLPGLQLPDLHDIGGDEPAGHRLHRNPRPFNL